MVLIVQYRPPLDAYCVEFPAGLVDPGESPIEAGLRELEEETGFVATPEACTCSPALSYEPGMTDSCFHLITVVIDVAASEANRNPKPKPEASEDIRVFVVRHGRSMLTDIFAIQQQLEEHSNLKTIIDAKVYTYALALQSLPSS